MSKTGQRISLKQGLELYNKIHIDSPLNIDVISVKKNLVNKVHDIYYNRLKNRGITVPSKVRYRHFEEVY